MEQHLEGKNSHIVIPMETFNRDGVEELIDHSIKENDNLKKKKPQNWCMEDLWGTMKKQKSINNEYTWRKMPRKA